MKNNFSKLLFLIVFFIIHSSFAQEKYAFRILANQGNNSVKITASSQEWIPAKTGSKLLEDDEIMIAENSYMGLVHSGGRTLELKTAGVFPVKTLLEKINASTTSLAGKYAEFIFTQLTKEGKEDINKNSRINNKVTGSVERAAAPIQLMAPGTSYVYGPVVLLKWEAPQSTSEFVVTVKNLYENSLINEQTGEKTITIDITDPKLKNEKLLIVNVKAKENAKLTSNEVGLKKLPAVEFKKVEKDLNLLQAEAAEETPLNKIIMATFYEQHHLLLDAITNYEAAIKLAPDVQDFKSAYDLFLVRNNLKN